MIFMDKLSVSCKNRDKRKLVQSVVHLLRASSVAKFLLKYDIQPLQLNKHKTDFHVRKGQHFVPALSKIKS